jgi:hypothetical protein
MDIPVNDKTVTLHPDIIRFYIKHNSKFSKVTAREHVCVFHNVDNFLETIALISKIDYKIIYLYDNETYSEEQMLRIIKMKAFI